MVYLSLFVVAFLSATLLPLGSEALLIYDISQNYSIYILWIVATLGNSLGSILNYIIGYRGEEYLEQKGYLTPKKMQNARGFFDRYGGWTLLLSWMPIVGDPLTFIAGVLKYNFRLFVLIVFIAKGFRYGVVIYLVG
ncbi:MAG: YqaA family protein [Sulfurovum sp.]